MSRLATALRVVGGIDDGRGLERDARATKNHETDRDRHMTLFLRYAAAYQAVNLSIENESAKRI
jgi:hypothetical protein